MARKENEFDKLEGGYRLTRIKRIEKYAFIPQIIGIIVVFFFFLYVSGAQLNPFYLPLFLSTLIILIWLLVLAIEYFIFRLMKIGFHKSASAKFLMAQRSMKKSYGAIILSGLLFLLLFTPYMSESAEEYLSPSGDITLGPDGEEAIYFTTLDRFDFTRVSDITVELNEGEEVTVSILSEDNWEIRNFDMRLNRDPGDPSGATADETFFYDMPSLGFGEYRLVIQSEEPAEVSYNINMELPGTRTFPFALTFLGFFISYSVFVVMLYPVKKKHADEAIYR